MILISFWEGFGLSVLEAMQAAVPVICSNTSSLDEVGGDAAIKVDPYDIRAIAEALQRVESNQGVRQSCIQKGLLHNAGYSWQDSSQRIYKFLEETAFR